MCGYTCIRYLVFFFNLIFFITGCGLIGTGAYLRVEKDEYLDLCDKYSWATGANILIAVGVIVVIVAFFGCFGAYKQSTIMLGIFFVLLLIIFILELAAGIYSATKRNEVTDELEGCLNDTLKNYNSTSEGSKDIWNKFQEKFKCCGVTGRSSYTYFGMEVPKSCGTATVGCKEKVENDFKDNLVAVVGVGIGFAMIQILGMVMSLWMICQIKGGGETA